MIAAGVGTVFGGLIGGGLYAFETWATGGEFDWGKMATASLAGAASGALAGFTMGGSLLVQGAAMGAVGGGIYGAGMAAQDGKGAGDIALAGIGGAVTGAIGGAAGGAVAGRILGGAANAAKASFGRHLLANTFEGAIDGATGGAIDGYMRTGTLAGAAEGAGWGTLYGGAIGGGMTAGARGVGKVRDGYSALSQSGALGRAYDRMSAFSGRVNSSLSSGGLGGITPRDRGFQKPATVRSASGVKGDFSKKGWEYRIDTNNISQGEGGFHIHVYQKGKEVAKVTGKGKYVKRHGGEILKKPTEIDKIVRKEIRTLVRHAQRNL